jgi:hypothetical protein
MQNIKHLALISVLCLTLSCQDQTSSTDLPETQESAEPNRNMFGHHIPRGLTKASEGLAEGYVMFTVPNSALIYLINRKGEVVHQWKGNYSVDVLGGYLMDDGSLIQCAIDPDYPVFGHGGPYGRIQKINWDSKMLWDYELANREEIVHHDIAVMSNGNILAITYELTSYDDAIAWGRKPEMIPKDGPWLEKIIEIEPQGKYDGRIVWEWHVKDHLIQDFDATKTNYGAPKDHPELLDFNMGHPVPPSISQDSLDILKEKGMAERNDTPGSLGADIYHFNAINYNEALDQIAISSPHLNEVFIIDHSTTTSEASGHAGGKSGKGGDFLFRWGNPRNYQRGDSTNQQLFGQHDVRWIEEGKPGAGNLTIFNNHPPSEVDFFQEVMGNPSKNYSAVYEITPPLDSKGMYLIEKNKPFGPEKPSWVYVSEDTLAFYSPFISSSHRMHNGNTLINEGARGRFFEVTPAGKIVWEYLNPYRGEIRKPNGDPVFAMFLTYSQFRATFIPADHPAFAGKQLKPLEPQPEAFVLPPAPAEKPM